MTVEYEWQVGKEDGSHSDFFDAFSDIDQAKLNDASLTVELVRIVRDSDGFPGPLEREYAELTEDGLPPAFDGGTKVPQKFLKKSIHR